MSGRRVFVVERDQIVRRGFEVFLTAEGFRVVGAAADLPTAEADIATSTAEVLVVDLTAHPVGASPEFSPYRSEPSMPRALAYIRSDQVAQAMQSGARGFVVRGSPPERLTEAINSVAAGGMFHDRNSYEAAPMAAEPARKLTQRERQIVLLLAQGMSGAEIADSLHVSPTTVRTHVQNAMTKLRARTRAHLVALLLFETDVALS